MVHFIAPINCSPCSQLIDKCFQPIQQGADELIIKIATMGGECSYGFCARPATTASSSSIRFTGR